MSSYPFKYEVADKGLSMLASLPMGALYLLVSPVRFVLHRVMGYRKKVIRKNLINSFPEKSPSEIKKIEKGFYHHLCDCIVEAIKLRHISDKELAERMVITNPEMVENSLAAGVPVVLMLGHIGNWEWVPELTMSVKTRTPFGEIYRKMHDQYWGEIIHNLRDRWDNVTQIPQDDAVKTIFRWNRDGAWIVGFLADQRPNGKNLNHWMTFLNQDTPVAVGAEQIGKHTKAKFIYADVERKSRGHYTLTYKEIIPDPNSTSPYPVMEEYLKMLETTIKRNPSIWLWSHNRWKYKHPDKKN